MLVDLVDFGSLGFVIIVGNCFLGFKVDFKCVCVWGWVLVDFFV